MAPRGRPKKTDKIDIDDMREKIREHAPMDTPSKPGGNGHHPVSDDPYGPSPESLIGKFWESSGSFNIANPEELIKPGLNIGDLIVRGMIEPEKRPIYLTMLLDADLHRQLREYGESRPDEINVKAVAYDILLGLGERGAARRDFKEALIGHIKNWLPDGQKPSADSIRRNGNRRRF